MLLSASPQHGFCLAGRMVSDRFGAYANAVRDCQGERMFERLKRALVDSFVGAIALGYLLAQSILHFVNIFASPIAGWVSRNNYRGILPGGASIAGFSLKDALPDLSRFVVLLLVWYLLVRWLYITPPKTDVYKPAQSPEQPA